MIPQARVCRRGPAGRHRQSKSTELRNEKALARAYGTDMADKIKLRMALLRAASNLGQVPAEKPMRRHELKGDLKGHFGVDLVHSTTGRSQ
jgi:plasmid maintenance system killer protein